MTVIACHQPNWIPGRSVIEKVKASDAVIWLDDVAYTRGGWTNRNRMPDGSWLTIPLRHSTLDGAIRDVEISYEREWIEKHVKTLRQHYGGAAEPIVAELEQRPRKLCTLNLACLRVLLPDAHGYLQSQIAKANALISDSLAAMVAEVGGTMYLSGPSGKAYLDEEPFRQRGIKVEYWHWDGPNPCALETLVTA